MDLDRYVVRTLYHVIGVPLDRKPFEGPFSAGWWVRGGGFHDVLVCAHHPTQSINITKAMGEEKKIYFLQIYLYIYQ